MYYFPSQLLIVILCCLSILFPVCMYSKKVQETAIVEQDGKRR